MFQYWEETHLGDHRKWPKQEWWDIITNNEDTLAFLDVSRKDIFTIRYGRTS